MSHRSAALELSRGLGSQARKLFGPEEMGSTGVCPDHSGRSLEVHSYGHLMRTYGRGLSGLSTRGLCIGRWHSELELSCLLHIDQSSGEGPASKWWLRKGTACCPVFFLTRLLKLAEVPTVTTNQPDSAGLVWNLFSSLAVCAFWSGKLACLIIPTARTHSVIMNCPCFSELKANVFDH